jgi:hypothetical protein
MSTDLRAHAVVSPRTPCLVLGPKGIADRTYHDLHASWRVFLSRNTLGPGQERGLDDEACRRPTRTWKFKTHIFLQRLGLVDSQCVEHVTRALGVSSIYPVLDSWRVLLQTCHTEHAFLDRRGFAEPRPGTRTS